MREPRGIAKTELLPEGAAAKKNKLCLKNLKDSLRTFALEGPDFNRADRYGDRPPRRNANKKPPARN
jgi:hypothetical protein